MSRSEPIPQGVAAILDAVHETGTSRVKVAVCDVEGVLRGKYLHVDRLAAATEEGLGFDVLGTDIADRPWDDDFASGRRLGFPDSTVRLDLSTYRQVPWDDNVPFFLGEFTRADGSPHPLCPRQVLRRVLARAAAMSYRVMVGMEFEFFNFHETPQSWARKEGGRPEPITQGKWGYSLLRANAHRDYFAALMEETSRFRVPLESLHTENGPGVYEAAILYGDALEAADRAVLFKAAAKEIAARFGIMPSFMAKWHHRYPGCSGHIHQSLSMDGRNVFHDANGPHGGVSRLFESYLAGQVGILMEFGPMIWPTVNSYKRLVDGFFAPTRATWGVDNRTAAFRVLAGSPASTRVETRMPGSDVNPYLAIAAVVAAGLEGVARGLELTAPPVTGDNQGAEGAVRVPRTLVDSTRAFHASRPARDWFGDDFVSYFAQTRELELRQYLDAVTDWERQRYFEIV